MYSRTQRPLDPAELRLLRAVAAETRKSNALVWRRVVGAVAALVLPLWAVTALATRRLLEPTALWLPVGGLIGLLSGLADRKSRLARQARFEDALRANRAEEITIAAMEMVELEKRRQQGPCYAFQVEPDKILVIKGPAYFATPTFPNSDFSIATIQDSSGRVVDTEVHERGHKLRPARVISLKEQKHLRSPEHLEILDGRIDDLERILRTGPSGF